MAFLVLDSKLILYVPEVVDIVLLCSGEKTPHYVTQNRRQLTRFTGLQAQTS